MQTELRCAILENREQSSLDTDMAGNLIRGFQKSKDVGSKFLWFILSVTYSKTFCYSILKEHKIKLLIAIFADINHRILKGD